MKNKIKADLQRLFSSWVGDTSSGGGDGTVSTRTTGLAQMTFYPSLVLMCFSIVQFFSFAGQICFRSDVNTNNLYLLIFTTDGYSPTICHCRTWEQWRQSNDTIQATVQSMTFIAIFPRVLQRKQLNTNRMETVVDICFISDRWQSCSMVMNRGFFVRKSVIHFVWSEWTWGPSLVWWSQLTPSPPAYT